jgi:hypothetical protein
VQVNLDCSKLEQIVHSLSLVRECDVVRSGALRMSTPFSYPNGDYIDVFLEARKDLFQQRLSLSDYGHTSLYLRSAQLEIAHDSKKQEVLLLILSQLDVKLKGEDLYVEINPSTTHDISDAIFRLSQACLRISDFASHLRPRSENPFCEQVAGFFRSAGINFLSDQKAPGLYKNDVLVDFETFGKEKKSYVCVLSPMTPSSIHTSANEIFRKWHDIKGHGTDHNLVTIYNDKLAKIRPADRQRISDYSKLLSYPSNAEILRSELAA